MHPQRFRPKSPVAQMLPEAWPVCVGLACRMATLTGNVIAVGAVNQCPNGNRRMNANFQSIN